jgi:hypothetical protein
MKIWNGRQLALATTLLGAVALTTSARGGGENTRYTFSTAPVNSMGVKSMADLRGKPVLIDFWGTR